MVAELSGQGHAVRDLLEVAGLARSSYYYALAHPQQPTRVQLRPKVAQIFSRTPNGCGHRQVAMCLRAEEGERIADKTVLKMMREMGLRCGIRRERAYHRYNSYKGDVGQSFKNIIGRDFKADGPWQKLGTDVTEFKLSFGKADLATYITHWSTTRRQVKLKGLTPGLLYKPQKFTFRTTASDSVKTRPARKFASTGAPKLSAWNQSSASSTMKFAVFPTSMP